MEIFNDKRIHAFFSQIRLDKRTDCWEWVGVALDGYGIYQTVFEGTKRNIYTHRLMAVMMHRADIPEEAKVLHECNNRRCCNPEHLRLGTQGPNLLNSWDAARVTRSGKLVRRPWKESKRKTDQFKKHMALRYHPNRSYSCVGSRIQCRKNVESRQARRTSGKKHSVHLQRLKRQQGVA